MNEVLDYLYNKYKEFEGIRRETFHALLEYYPDRIIVAKDGDTIVGVALFVLLGEDNLCEIIQDYKNLLDQENMFRYLNDNGQHLHFLGVASDKKVILRELHKIINDIKPETYSWYNAKRRLFLKERICQSQFLSAQV